MERTEVKIHWIRENLQHKNLINYSIEKMKTEFDMFIQEMKELPWFYNERALLGLYASGLVRRNSNMVILQEFVCNKGKNGKKRGRGDLLFSYGKNLYMAEAKFRYISVDTSLTFEDAAVWAKEVLNQAEKYRETPDLKNYVKRSNVFSLCFESVYCNEKNIGNFLSEGIQEWIDKNKIEKSGLDFYCFIHADEKEIKKKGKFIKCENRFFPAIAVYGVFNKG